MWQVGVDSPIEPITEPITEPTRKLALAWDGALRHE